MALTLGRSPAGGRPRVGVVAAVLFVCALVARPASAHNPTFARYSKYEATTNGRSIAFVFALDKVAVVQLIESSAAHARVDLDRLPDYRGFFSQYLFERVSVSNQGRPCDHPPQLSQFFWDAPTGRVVAVTKFVCADDLSTLVIGARLTHDMPMSHEMVGDLRHGRALERSFFEGDNLEATIVLPTLAQQGALARRPPPRPRTRISFVAVPDQVRRYDRLAGAELGIEIASDGPGAASAGRTFLIFIASGIVHIFRAPDHVLFILALLLGAPTSSSRRLAVVLGSFCVAVAIGSTGASLGFVALPVAVAGALLALTVGFVAVDSLTRPQAGVRAPVGFSFGLVHGLFLGDGLVIGRDRLATLAGFDGGLALGLLAIVAPLFPVVLLLRRRPPIHDRVRALVCGAIAVVAAVLVVMRVRAGLAAPPS